MIDLDKSYKDFDEYLVDVAPKFKEILIQHLNNARVAFESEKHADVDKYLYKPLLEFSENAGKMHRPLTCLASFMALNDKQNTQIVLPVAAAIEHFQSAALIHDDIADAGELRRGKPCLYKEQGLGIAINAGDFGLACVIPSVVSELKNLNVDKDKILDIVEELSCMEYMTIEGQALDLGWARDERFDITEDDYIVMATKKSAYYSVSIPLTLGAICANASESVIKNLEICGEKIGLAFQIRDDYLNLVVDSNKDFRNDITEGKRTLIVCKALETCSQNDRNKLIDILKSHTKDTNELQMAVDIMTNCGSIDYANKKANELCDEAKKLLDETLPNNAWKDIILDMANWASNRRA